MSWHPNGNTAALICNGLITNSLATKNLVLNYETVVAVDGGLIHCDAMEIVPHLITGDLDSATPALLKKYYFVPQLLTPNQDKTDLEKCLEYLAHFFLKKITVFGALGLRIDHELNNLRLLSQFPKKVYFETETQIVSLLGKEETLFFHKGQTISLIPFNGPVHGIRTQGLRWNLNNQTLDHTFMSVSNCVCEEKVEISFDSGDLLLCEYKL